jgi:hypothetical protein
MSEEQNSGAGLSYAPQYDKSKEFDPNQAEVIPTKEVMKREDFDFFRRRMERQASVGRLILIVAVLIAVGGNIWLTLGTQDIVIENVNQARHDQALLDERLVVQVSSLEAKIEALTQQLEAAMATHGSEAAAE